MPSKASQFKVNTTTPSPKKDEQGFSISLWAVGFFLLVIGIVAFATVKGSQVYQEWKEVSDVVVFAKENPELVRSVKTKYDAGITELKDSITNPKE